jgi:hypothetical protein
MVLSDNAECSCDEHTLTVAHRYPHMVAHLQYREDLRLKGMMKIQAVIITFTPCIHSRAWLFENQLK